MIKLQAAEEGRNENFIKFLNRSQFVINDWLQEWSFLEKGLQSHHQWKPSMRQKYSLMTQKSFKFLIFRCFINFTKMFVFDRSTIEIVEILNSCIFNSWPIMLTIFFFRTIKLPFFSEGQVSRFLLFFYSDVFNWAAGFGFPKHQL